MHTLAQLQIMHSPVAVQAELAGTQAAHHEASACWPVSQAQVAQLLLQPGHTGLSGALQAPTQSPL